MEDFATILHRDYGLKPQGMSAPMTATRNTTGVDITDGIDRTGSVGKGKSYGGSGRSGRSSVPVVVESLQDDLLFGGNGARPSSRSTFGSGAGDFLGGASVAYGDVFGGPPQYTSPSLVSQSPSMQNYDDIFGVPTKVSTSSRGSSLPVFDAPVFDDDIFGGVPGVRNASVAYDDVFNGGLGTGSSPAAFEDLLAGFGAMETKATVSARTGSQRTHTLNSGESLAGDSVYDDLLLGFGNIDSAKAGSVGDAKQFQHAPLGIVDYSPQKAADKPFVVLEADPIVSGVSAAPLSDLNPFNISSRPHSASSTKASMNGLTEGIPDIGDISSSIPPISAETTNKSAGMVRDSVKRSETDSSSRSAFIKESSEAKPVRRNHAGTSFVSDQGKPSTNGAKFDVDGSIGRFEEAITGSPSRKGQQLRKKENVTLKAEEPRQFPKVEKKRNVDEFWITVNDVKLATQPSTVPPPSRSPPIPGSRPILASRKQEGSQDGTSNLNEPQQQSSGISWQTSRATMDPVSKVVSNTPNAIDELEEFASGVSRSRKEVKGNAMAASVIEDEQVEGSAAVAASAGAMKDALERAEAKIKLVRETRDRERDERERDAKLAKLREERERAREAREKEEREQAMHEAHEREEKERLAHEAHEREEKEKAARETREREDSEWVPREREDREREAKSTREAHEREEKEREVRERRRKEREKEKEREREREKDRIAVERATQEARERAEARAMAEARERTERAAVERATAEARERAAAEARDRAAERAAVERAASEARARAERAAVERANAEARERAAEKAAAERAAAEARERAERAAAEKVAAERAVAEARERAERAAAERAAATREQQRRNENELDSLFMANSRASSAPRQRPAAVDTLFETRQANNKTFSSEGQKSSVGATGVRKVASTDDFASLFGVPPSDEFQQVEGELPERQRARLERHQRTIERAAKALEEKNQRDIQCQKDQAERHRAAEMLDAEIKRWAAGKEGNLRALLSTLQYVLWPECGWQPVSLTDLIAAASVKKVYRKATLCVHPDKVQQKGATIQQKYIAEKVFDLLKESWNKFNSEELF